MRLKNYSKKTITNYLLTIRMFHEFWRDRKGWVGISKEDAKQYLLLRIDSGCSWSAINYDYSALRNYCKNIMIARWSVKKMPRLQ